MEANDRHPAIVIFNDGTIKILIPLQVRFIEQTARALLNHIGSLLVQPTAAPSLPEGDEQE